MKKAPTGTNVGAELVLRGVHWGQGTQHTNATPGPSQLPVTEDTKWRFRFVGNSNSKAAGQ
jgi:hypothetical protein